MGAEILRREDRSASMSEIADNDSSLQRVDEHPHFAQNVSVV